MKTRATRWIVIVLLAFLFATCTAALNAKQKEISPCREQAMNDTMNWTLSVGAEWRAQRRTHTWDELQREVAIRMKLKRKQPWK